MTAIDLEEATRRPGRYSCTMTIRMCTHMLTYEYYLVSTEFLRRQFKRANHATNLGNGKNCTW